MMSSDETFDLTAGGVHFYFYEIHPHPKKSSTRNRRDVVLVVQYEIWKYFFTPIGPWGFFVCLVVALSVCSKVSFFGLRRQGNTW